MIAGSADVMKGFTTEGTELHGESQASDTKPLRILFWSPVVLLVIVAAWLGAEQWKIRGSRERCKRVSELINLFLRADDRFAEMECGCMSNGLAVVRGSTDDPALLAPFSEGVVSVIRQEEKQAVVRRIDLLESGEVWTLYQPVLSADPTVWKGEIEIIKKEWPAKD